MCRYAFAHSPLYLKCSDLLVLHVSPSVDSTALLSLLWQVFTTCSVTKAMPIQFINGRSHIKKWRGHKTTLSGYYACLSRDLLLMALGADTHTYTNIRRLSNFKKPGAHWHVACACLI